MLVSLNDVSPKYVKITMQREFGIQSGKKQQKNCKNSCFSKGILLNFYKTTFSEKKRPAFLLFASNPYKTGDPDSLSYEITNQIT